MQELGGDLLLLALYIEIRLDHDRNDHVEEHEVVKDHEAEVVEGPGACEPSGCTAPGLELAEACEPSGCTTAAGSVCVASDCPPSDDELLHGGIGGNGG